MKALTNLVPVIPVRALTLKTARVTMAVALVFAAASAVQGDTLTWDGGHGNWSDPSNWDPNGVPSDGDTLVFAFHGLYANTTNDLFGLNLNSIHISSGMDLYGNPVGVSTELWVLKSSLAAPATEIHLDIDLDASASIIAHDSASYGSAIFHIYGDIDTGSYTLNVGGVGTVYLHGSVGGSGSVVKFGDGTVYLQGTSGNTYTGSTTVEEGLLVLDKDSGNAVPGALIIGGNDPADPPATVRQEALSQIGTDLTINRMGTYDMNGYAETINDLNLNGGADIDSGSVTLSIRGDVSVGSGFSGISGTLGLLSGNHSFNIDFWPIIFPQANCYLYADVTGSGNIIMTGGGIMRMYGNNSYSGTTLVDNGSIQIESETALGTTAGGTTVNAGSSLYLATSASSIQVGNEALALGGAIRSYGNSNSWTGDIVLSNNASLSVQGNYLHLPGVLSGSGGFTKYGDGTLILSGSTANSYTGDTYVDNGTLLLNKSGGNAVRYGSLAIGTGAGSANEVIVREQANYQIGDSVAVTIHEDGWLNVDSYSDTVGPITFNGGHAGSSTGSLRLGGTVTVNSSSSEALLDGNVYIGTGTRAFSVAEGPVGYELRVTAVLSGNGLLKTGEGLMALLAANTFTGTAQVSQGRLYALNNNAFGTTVGGTVVGASGFIQLVNANIGAEPLTLGRTDSGSVLFATGSCSWLGDVILNEDSTMGSGGSMEFSGAISGSGGITWNGSGNLILSGSAANTYTGETYVNGGMLVLNKPIYNVTVPGNLHIGDGLGGADADVVRLLTTSQIPSTSRITIAGSGLFDMNDLTEYFGSLAGSGHVNMGSGNLGCGEDGTSTTFSGQIEGAGELRKYGTGTFTLSGNNIYSGTTRVYEGTLLVNGSQPGSGVVVSAPGTLGGIGTVGAINSSGSVAPGASAGQLGSGSTSLQSGSSFDVELDGDSPIDYDQLDVGGSVSLGNSDLNVSWGFVPTVGDEFTIIDNDGGDAVTGIFNGLAEGASFVAGNVTLKITYAGGTGNDVVLGVTDVEPTEDLRVTSIETAGTNVVLQWTGGVPLYVVERKTALTDATWIPVTAPMSGTQTNLPMDAPASFYRVKGGN